MKTFAWLALPVSAALLTACGGTAPAAPGKIDNLTPANTLEMQVGNSSSGNFEFRNAGGSDLQYTSKVTFPNNAPAWLEILEGATGTVKAGKSQVVKFKGTCPNTVGTYTASIMLTANGVSKTVPATLKCVAAPVVETPDTEKPVLVLDSASDVNTPSVTITGTATDNIGVTNVKYTLNGGTETSVNIEPGTSVALSFSVSALQEGSNEIVVKAYDAAGLVSDARTVSVTYTATAPADTTKPTISTVTFEQGNKPDGMTYTVDLSVAASDDRGVSHFMVSIDGGEGKQHDASDASPFALSLGKLNVGSHTVTVTAYDEAGNASEAKETTVVVEDVTAPQALSLKGSTQSVLLSATPFTLLFEGSDNIGITEVRFYQNGEQVGTGDFTPESWAKTLNFMASDNGTITFTAKAFDAAGNASDMSDPVTLRVDIDTEVPTVGAQGLALVKTHSVTLEGSAADNRAGVSVSYSLNGGEAQAVTLADGTFSQVVSGLQEGNNTIVFTAKDAEGLSASHSVTVMADTIAPTVELGASASTVTTPTTVTLTAHTVEEGSGVVKVEFYKNGVLAETVANAPYSYSVTFDNANQNGTHSYTALAYDAAGNISVVSNTQTVTVNMADTTAPMVMSVSARLNNGGNTSVTVKASDNIGVKKFEYKVGTGSFTTVTPTLASGTEKDGTWTFTIPKDNGIKENTKITVRVSDAAGNATQDSTEAALHP